ncbi:hypothetical protein GH714_023158 [Hevea brasiliensis]|uniref:Pentatricopeptide repeat-containing protein n=1 Tax=Hevea brasiliensis TaxID=3981 RepID=A0A6A6KNE4_HEVBR|nr:hypothetical protein GH714_023158 [Hevea brasiliensis]
MVLPLSLWLLKVRLVVNAEMSFDELLPELNMVGLNAMMAVHAQQGDKGYVLGLYNAMHSEGLVPVMEDLRDSKCVAPENAKLKLICSANKVGFAES